VAAHVTTARPAGAVAVAVDALGGIASTPHDAVAPANPCTGAAAEADSVLVTFDVSGLPAVGSSSLVVTWGACRAAVVSLTQSADVPLAATGSATLTAGAVVNVHLRHDTHGLLCGDGGGATDTRRGSACTVHIPTSSGQVSVLA